MKRIIAVIALAALVTASAFAQQPPPTVQSGLKDIFNAITDGGTNWLVVPYGIYTPGLAKDKYGAGAAVLFPLKQGSFEAWAGPRFEWFSHHLEIISGTATLDLPIKPFSGVPVKFIANLTITPFVYAGVGAAYHGGAGNTIGIVGYGAALQVWSSTSGRVKLEILADREDRTLTGYSYCVGPAFRLSF